MGIMLNNRQDNVDSLTDGVQVIPMEGVEDIPHRSSTLQQQHADIANQLEVIAVKIDSEYGPQIAEVVQPSSWCSMKTCLLVGLTGLTIGLILKK